MRSWLLSLALVLTLCLTAPPFVRPAAAWGGWTWPVVGAVIRGFDPPLTPYGSGHRGIDIATAVGTPVHAAAAGAVSFAGPVGGELFVSIDHGGGLVSTYSWLSAVLVRTGDVVAVGDVVGVSGIGHPGSVLAHLHVGVKLDGAYVDPFDYLLPPNVVDLISLAPLLGPEAAAGTVAARGGRLQWAGRAWEVPSVPSSDPTSLLGRARRGGRYLPRRRPRGSPVRPRLGPVPGGGHP
jgi:murein DD-endopeptidase MepM/ murein hydrolase activator NlpD